MQRNPVHYALCILVFLSELGKKKKIGLAARYEWRKFLFWTDIGGLENGMCSKLVTVNLFIT